MSRIDAPAPGCYWTPMLLEHFRRLAAYNRTMNENLYSVCAELDDGRRKRDLKAFFRSIHGTLNHLLLADRAWMTRFTGDSQRFQSKTRDGQAIEVRSLDQELYASFDELTLERRATDDAICEWADSLDEDSLRREITYQTSTGLKLRHPIILAVEHFFNHQTHHRGQVTTLLSQLGCDFGVTDLLIYSLKD